MKWKISNIQDSGRLGITYYRRGNAALGEPSIVYMICYGSTWL